MKYETNSITLESTDTYFASADRSDISHIRSLNTLVESTPYIKNLIDAMPFVVVILNSNRQIVAANQKVCSLLGVDIEDALGKRPGELIGCIHADDGPNGCGTEAHCRVCGAVNAILDSMNSNNKVTEECRVTLHNGSSLDWEVTTSSLAIEGHSLICMGVQDISHQKRRNSLERTFFHDIINQLGAITGFVRIMADEHIESVELEEIKTLTDELLEEVQSQRNLTLAENGDLVPKLEPVEIKLLLERLVQLYQSHPVAKGRMIRISVPDKLILRTDAQLLKRVLANMIKNALEASSQGQTVTASCDCIDGLVSICVHNAAVIPQDVQLQIFNRSFSTKDGLGRGVGTYSIKLLGEKYLKGDVSFTSNAETGTTFSITLPLHTD